jgi:hypothetical protein
MYAAAVSAATQRKEKHKMDALVIALIATLGMYRQQKVSVPEPAEFRPFDLKALRSPDQNKHDPLGRLSNRKRSYVLQTAP